MGKKGIVLKDDIDRPLVDGPIGDILFAEENFARIGFFQSCDQAQQSGFAAAAWP